MKSMVDYFKQVLTRQSYLNKKNLETTTKLLRLQKDNVEMKEQMAQLSTTISNLTNLVIMQFELMR